MNERTPADPRKRPRDPRADVDDPEHRDWEVDEASDESFPASDPPAFTGTTAGCGDHDAAARDEDEDEDRRDRRGADDEERPNA